MSTDLPDPDITPALSSHYRPSDRAEVRGMPHVHPPDATDEEWEQFHQEELDCHKAIAQARWLMRVAHNPTGDATWPAIAASLRDVSDLLRARIRCHAIRPDAVSLVDYTRHQLAIVERLRTGHRA